MAVAYVVAANAATTVAVIVVAAFGVAIISKHVVLRVRYCRF